MTKILMTAFGGLMALSGVALAGEQGSVAPMGAFVQDIGGQQVVGYYLAENDACQITMMTGASPSDENADPQSSRIRFALAPMGSATFESEQGGKLSLSCGEHADTLVVNAMPATRQLASR